MLVLLWRFLLSSTYFSHVAFLLTFVTHFVLVFAAPGIVVSTAAIALSFWLKMWRFSFFFARVDIVVTAGRARRLPASIRFFEAISVAVALSTTFSNVSSRSTNSRR